MSRSAALGGKTYTAHKPGSDTKRLTVQSYLSGIPDISKLSDRQLKGCLCAPAPTLCERCDIIECRYGREWRRRQQEGIHIVKKPRGNRYRRSGDE